jgi:hypothetical protein
MIDDSTARLARINTSLEAAAARFRGEDSRRLRANFMKSLAELKRVAEDEKTTIHVRSSPVDVRAERFNRMMTMALKDRICAALNNAKTAFTCDTVPKIPRLCTAINAAIVALGCGGGGPPEGCATNPAICMSPTTYCDVSGDPNGLCIKQPYGGVCNLNEECQSGICTDNMCQ